MRNFHPVKVTVNLISIDPPPLKSGNSDSRKYPGKLCPIEYELDINVFVHLKLMLFKTETMEKLSE